MAIYRIVVKNIMAEELPDGMFPEQGDKCRGQAQFTVMTGGGFPPFQTTLVTFTAVGGPMRTSQEFCDCVSRQVFLLHRKK